ncbi:lysophospholipid acyltransferase family protein [Priestia koreensis]|uniref:lysophospholipid acyltransferase family protein n=1 Tax=Priestia koreensis TaxID=284581 RepID=UPI00345A23D2
MIYPTKSPFFERLLTRFVHHQLKKHFYRVHYQEAYSPPKNEATIFIVNHSNWWDGLVLFYINAVKIKHDSYAMMSEEGMKSFSFFKKIGAFSVNPTSPKHVLKSLQFAKKLLGDKKSVWIFPQGQEEHQEKRPLTFASGTSYLVDQVQSVCVIPVSFYYTYHHDQRPELYVYTGNPISFHPNETRAELTSTMASKLTDQLDEVKSFVIEEKNTGYETIVSGYKTISEWLTWWKGRGKK